MNISMEDLKRLELLDKSIETMFDEKGTLKSLRTLSLTGTGSVISMCEELLWLSTFLYKLLHDLTHRYEDSVKRTIKILDRINSRMKK